MLCLGDGTTAAKRAPVTVLSSQHSQLGLSHSYCSGASLSPVSILRPWAVLGGVCELHKHLPRCPRFSLATGLRADGNIEHGCLRPDELMASALHSFHCLRLGSV